MNKNIKITVILISIICIIGTILTGMFFIGPKVKEQSRLASEAAALAEAERLKAEKEQARLILLEEDLINFQTMEYGGIMLGMTGISEWSEDVPKFFLGLDVLKNRAVINSPEEFVKLWDEAMNSGNEISFACIVLDPEKIYSDGEDMLNLCGIIEAHPEMQFRIFMPNYSSDYWYSKSDEEFDLLISEYDDTMTKLIAYTNVTLACYTGEDWIVESEGGFCDKETGDLRGAIADKLFLYTYMDNWIVHFSNKDTWIEKIKNNCREQKTVSEDSSPSDEFMSDYDVIFLGDSIFALSDGPYSTASVIGEMTGAKTYNCSKGGARAACDEEMYAMSTLVDHFIEGTATGFEEWEVFDANVTEYGKKGHRDRKTVIVLNSCINDYISASDMLEYEDAFATCYDKLYDAFPDAKLVFVAPYYIQLGDNGNVPNELGLTMGQYAEAAMEVAENYGVYCLDLSGSGKFGESNAAFVLEDGTHPTPAGCKEVAKVMEEYFRSLFGENVLEGNN